MSRIFFHRWYYVIVIAYNLKGKHIYFIITVLRFALKNVKKSRCQGDNQGKILEMVYGPEKFKNDVITVAVLKGIVVNRKIYWLKYIK